MALFFIDTSDDVLVLHDEVGFDFPDLEAAKAAAVRALPDMVREARPVGDRRTVSAVVREHDGRSALRVSLTLVVEHLTSPDPA